MEVTQRVMEKKIALKDKRSKKWISMKIQDLTSRATKLTDIRIGGEEKLYHGDRGQRTEVWEGQK